MCAALSTSPLTLNYIQGGDGEPIGVPSIVQVLGGDEEVVCSCCDEKFQNQQTALQHLFMEHRLVIADVERVASLKEYLEFWKLKFNENKIAEFCTTMLCDTKVDGNTIQNQKYYLLSDVLPIDFQLRRDLQKNRLEKILEQQKLERNDKNYERECLICRMVLKGLRTDFLEHLFEKHNFYIAKLDNLVFTADLIEFINDKLMNNVCVYCDKVFKDRVILKEHMRKKGHKRINPKNKEYDRFFISNYLEMGKNWQSYLKNVDVANSKKCQFNKPTKRDPKNSSSDEDSNWSDWDEKDNPTIVCLFCKHSQDEYADIIAHMKKQHNFLFDSITRKLNYYEKFKIVNYIRRQIFLNRCIECNVEFSNTTLLLAHMTENKHLIISNPVSWNQPEYYFPTYEDDGLLYYLEDNEDVDETPTPDDCSSDDTNHISKSVALSVIEQ